MGQCKDDMRSFRVYPELHLLHVDDHERGDAGGEDEEHDHDVDHGVPLHPPLVVCGPGRAADQHAAGVLQLQQAGHVHQVAVGVLDYHQLVFNLLTTYNCHAPCPGVGVCTTLL